MSATAAAALPVLDNTMGATLIGVLVGSALWGVSAMQVWYYYATYKEDVWYYKWLVAAVFTSDTIHQILISHSIYTYLITQFGNYVYLGEIVWSILLEVLFNGFTALLVQGFMTVRVFKLTPQKWRWPAAGLIVALVTGEFVSVVAYYAQGRYIKTFAGLVKLKTNSEAINGFGAAADVLIAAVMCVVLQRSRTGFKNSDTMINTLIMFTMNTGLLTSLCAVASLVSIVAAPNTFIYIAFFFNIGRLYSNSMLATLNARSVIRAQLTETQSVSMSKLRKNNTSVNASQRPSPSNTVDLKVANQYQLNSMGPSSVFEGSSGYEAESVALDYKSEPLGEDNV
ncbi:hypothetical protein FIBSPDRAFT_940265 [Athelia psychrophila]|uniref:DUF6534 domain-containing protein n=1 Tax=Athelia psychrophila TaxID=1759441 RepID=A0A167WBP9_9AGAM|nr:hypothetical protein FIBSPDRAFT_940265 [Fibularhizoctonia sp. CBS 109695]